MKSFVKIFTEMKINKARQANQSIEAIVTTPVESGKVGLHSASFQTLG
ncbi:hypothetical protein P4C99_21340 [Pontiellaceae bacterium B1224]|nr:hypothetical protein [Pontiellaceae bacterium B1224]